MADNEEIQGPPVAPEGTPVAADDTRNNEGTPVLRADATDDEEHRPEAELPPNTKQIHGEGTCPVCGLSACGHNLPYIKQEHQE